MNVTRHEKVNRIAEAGQNLCGNAFFSNAERIVSALESDSCRELNISFSVTVKASNKDELGIGKIEFENPSLVITNNHKYKDSFDDVVLDFVEPELPGINDDDKKKEKNVKGVVIDASRQLTTSEARQELVYMDEKTGKTYFAGQGLGDDAFMTFKGLPTDGSRHRYVNKALPVQKTIEDAETDLIAFATKKGWKRVEDEAKQESEEDLFLEAKEWYKNTPEWEVTAGGKFGNRTIIKLQKVLNLTYNQASSFWDRIIDEENPSESSKESGIAAPKKKGKKKKDTMEVERTLTDIGFAPCNISDMTGCCQCEKEDCEFAHVKFGEASVCGKEEACSAECPRLVK